MKSITQKIVFSLVFLVIIASCAKKNEPEGTYLDLDLNNLESKAVADSAAVPMSMAASQEVEGKKFVRKADVNMEVSDVYQATIYIENTLKEMGGFVTLSNYRSEVLEEKVFPQSDEKSMLVREYITKNQMQVRVPTEKLSDFLKQLNDKNIFLRERIITAEDVSTNIKMAELEKQRMAKHKAQLSQQTNTIKNAEAVNENERELIYQKINDLNLADELKYSTVEIYLSEPKSKISQVEIPNTKSLKNKYQGGFGYSIKEAFANGFYGFQQFLILVAHAWMFILAGILGIFVWRNRKKFWKKSDKEEEK
ncbi:MAG: DUF4349 domain-containing protein [Flavobacteriaceae bacterium]